MNKSIIKSIIFGILLGTFVYFTGPLIFIILILKFIFTPFGMGRMMMMNHARMHHHGMGMPPFAYAEKIRSMNDEEFTAFQNKMKERFENNSCCGHYRKEK